MSSARQTRRGSGLGAGGLGPEVVAGVGEGRAAAGGAGDPSATCPPVRGEGVGGAEAVGVGPTAPAAGVPVGLTSTTGGQGVGTRGVETANLPLMLPGRRSVRDPRRR